MSVSDGPVTGQKRQRLDLRITLEQKRRSERAALLSGQSLSGLILRGALREAEQSIRDHEIMTLSEEDSRAFAQALLDPPPPSARLLQAIELYNTEFGS
ncbi:MAG: DUF1778 domain-containing protein [Dehalococcoidia bacterium]